MDFFDVCDHVGLQRDNKHCRTYYEWLGPTFGPYNGGGFDTLYLDYEQGMVPPLGATFRDPFSRGRDTKLPPGTKFPKPYGKLWITMQQKRNDQDHGKSQKHILETSNAYLTTVTNQVNFSRTMRNAIEYPNLIKSKQQQMI